MKTKNGVKLLSVVAVMAMIVCAFAVVMPTEDIDAAGTTYLNGEITGDSTMNYGVGTNVVVESGKTLTIPDNYSLTIAGGKFTVEKGATVIVKAGGQLVFKAGTDEASTQPTITINGTITAEGTDSTESANGTIKYVGSIVNDATQYNATSKTGVVLSGNIVLERGAELLSETAGYITVNSGASIDVTQKSSKISAIENQTVLLNVGATFNLNGKADNVTVVATGTGSNTTSGAVKIDKYSGSAYTVDKNASSDLVFTVTTENTSALNSPTATTGLTVRQYILNIDGTIANGDTVSTVSPSTLPYYVSSGYKNYNLLPIISVTGTLKVENSSAFNINKNTQVNVSGSEEFGYDTKEGAFNATSSVAGSLLVTGAIDANSASFTISHDKDENNNSNRVVVDGGVIALTTKATLASFLGSNTDARIYGSVYLAEVDKSDDVIYIKDFDKAVADAISAGSDEVYVFAYGAQNNVDAKGASNRGAYTIESDITIPDDMTVYVWNALIVGEGATLTLEAGSEIVIYKDVNDSTMPPRDNDGRLFVEGKVVDYYGAMEDYEGVQGTFKLEGVNQMFVYEVKKISEDESYVTYTSLAVALSEAVSGEDIQLNGKVIIDDDMTIPENVTVSADESVKGTGIEVKSAKLTVNGVLDMNGTTFALTQSSSTASYGKIVVNNYITNVNDSNHIVWDGWENEKDILDGAYFTGIVGDAESSTKYIASVAVAAEASKSTDTIVIYGNVNMGDVTFTSGDEELKVFIYNGENDTATAGTITLSGKVVINTYNGTVTADVVGSDTTISLNKHKDSLISNVAKGTDDEITYQLQIESMIKKSDNLPATSDGSITVASGTLYIAKAFKPEMMTIESGAEVSITSGGKLITGMNPGYRINTLVKQVPLLPQSVLESVSGLIVDGTLSVGKSATLESEFVVINGTLSINASATSAVANISVVNGTVDVADKGDMDYNVMLLNGTIKGAVDPALYNGNTWGMIVAYPGSSVNDAKIAFGDSTASKAVTSTYYVNGKEYATVYATSGVIPVTAIGLFMEVSGYDEETAKFYSDAAMRQNIGNLTDVAKTISTLDTTSLSKFNLQSVIDAFAEDYFVGDYEDVYVGMDASSVAGNITTYTGLTVYIDGLSLNNIPRDAENGKYFLDVGTHTISVQINPAYTGTYTVSLNGKTVSGNSFEITGDMDTYQIVVTGELTQQGIVVDNGNSGSDDDGMGLTDILLIVLVVLIAVMAVMVALRLMRS